MSSVLEWFSQNAGVKVNKALSVEKSAIDDPSSGYGLFADLKLVDCIPQETTVELLRIPRFAKFDLNSLMALLNDDSQYISHENKESLQKVVKRVFSEFMQLENLGDILSETTILVFYFTLFALLRDQFELPRVIGFYLENVLLRTKVDSGVMSYDPEKDLYGQRPHFLAFNYSLQTLGSFFEKTVASSPPVEPLLRQVYAAVSSRCLEIPEEVNTGSDDFVVNTTLVPALDYANHDNEMQNAHFDVDRETGDVLLLLDMNRLPTKKKKFEVLISYSPDEDPASFMFFYGFIPSSAGAPKETN